MNIAKIRHRFCFLKDARDYQIVCLSLFLAMGVAMRDWSLQPAIVATAACTALISQGILTFLVVQKSVSTEPLQITAQSGHYRQTGGPLDYHRTVMYGYIAG